MVMGQSNLQNHIAIGIDCSTSMQGIMKDAVKVLNKVIEKLKSQSVKFNQETRVSVYAFSSDVKCIIYNMDVLRFNEITLKADGWTAMLECLELMIDDLQKIPQLYCDHAFLLYLITDGDDNNPHRRKTIDIAKKISNLPENFTIIGLAPNKESCVLMNKYGIPKGNVDKWDTSSTVEVEEKMVKSVDAYFNMRSAGIRSSTSLLDFKQLNSKNVGQVLEQVNSKNCKVIINGDETIQIKELCVNNVGKYVLGNGFYQLVKTEHIQPQKQIAIKNKKTGKIYSGDNARALLKLPSVLVKVKPDDFGEWDVFVQSTSVNRNIIPNQQVIYFNQL